MGFNIYPIIVEARDEIAQELKGNKEYVETSKKYSKLFNEIEELLPMDKKEIVFKFEEKETEKNNFEADAMYIKGLQHGVELAKLLKVDKNMYSVIINKNSDILDNTK